MYKKTFFGWYLALCEETTYDVSRKFYRILCSHLNISTDTRKVDFWQLRWFASKLQDNPRLK